jgi:Ca2+-binding EF-hand superfamily protein
MLCAHVFQDFVQGLSILSRGSLDEKLRWTFSLYDINGDGCITREEMTDIVTAIYELMGKFTEPCVDESTVKEKVDHIFQVNILSPHKYLDSFNILVNPSGRTRSWSSLSL